MKSNTNVFVGIRNIGDSNDNGTIWQGPLREGILWLAEQLGTATMQKRFAIGIGRDEQGARAALELQRGSNRLNTMELGDELDRLLSGESIDEVLDDVAAPTTSVDPRDTWKGATQ
jgi:hypothetical protein